MVGSIVENPQERRMFRQIQMGPPLAEHAAVENTHRIMPIEMQAASKQSVVNANNAVGNLLKRSLASCMKLAKTAFGSVSSVFGVFSGLKRISGGV